jgi:hypothetical protein
VTATGSVRICLVRFVGERRVDVAGCLLLHRPPRHHPDQAAPSSTALLQHPSHLETAAALPHRPAGPSGPPCHAQPRHAGGAGRPQLQRSRRTQGCACKCRQRSARTLHRPIDRPCLIDRALTVRTPLGTSAARLLRRLRER